MNEKGQYVYGFILADTSQHLGPIGIEKADVSTICYRNIAAVTSPTSLSSFDDLPKATLLRYLTVYQSVLESVLERQMVVPVKFGTVLQGNGAVRAALDQGYDQVFAGLRKLKNSIEMDVAAVWQDLRDVLAEIGKTEEIRVLKQNASGLPEDQQFDLRVRVGKQVKALLDQRREEFKKDIINALLPFAETHRVHGLMDDAMIMNAAFLIQRNRAGSLDAGITALDHRYGNRVNFRIIGPLPPYSFQTLEIKRMDYELLNEARNTLELDNETTVVEMREAYWKLTKQFHPDRFPGDADVQKKYERINFAYRLVNDYCRKNGCSFRKQDVMNWIRVEPVEAQGLMSTGHEN
jgi:hypothetical protein